jgi:prepilin peptidase CpaA
MSLHLADTLLRLALAGALLAAAYTDLREQRISNRLTFPLMLLGLAYHGMVRGQDGLAFAGYGLVLGLIVMIVPYLIGVMGAGDVKLMAAVGAILGPADLLNAFLLTSIFGGVYALGVLAMRLPYLKKVVRSLWDTMYVFLSTRRFVYVRVDAENRLPRLCYGVAISAGALVTMAAPILGFGTVFTWT